jgi:hypothetical protein
MEARLKDSIEGCCGGLDRRVDDVEPKTEARLISLEMARTEVETGHIDLEEQFEGFVWSWVISTNSWSASHWRTNQRSQVSSSTHLHVRRLVARAPVAQIRPTGIVSMG